MRLFDSRSIRAASLAMVLLCGAGAAAADAAKDAKKEQPAAKPGGKLQVDSPLVDVGEVVRGQEAKATFLLKNSGDGVLKVLSARPG